MRQTRWQVITGAPCSGKTTVLHELAKSGFQVVEESARAVINEALDKGKNLEDIRRDSLAFQRKILLRKDIIEKALPEDRTIIFDRGIPDSIAYYQLSDLPVAEPVAKSRLRRYDAVFHFDMLPFRQDRVRNEDEAAAVRLDHLIFDAYTFIGYNVIRVPAMPVKERVQFILKRM